ncbi:MAG: hypothetical protein J3K34DRAFT_409374 [Monoraphidium minutum]|nr:MAG: hypothetical protein J3K34DRAFT_409374 [Monoraphidium minutum]
MAAFALDWAAGHASSSAEAAAAAARLKRAGDHLLRRRPPGLPADECAWAVRRLGLTTLPPREASPSSSAARPPPASGASASAQGAPAPQAAAAAAGGEHKTAACTSCGAARGAPGVTLRPCTGCRPLLHTYYCCAEHQRADWPRHKAECKAAQQQLKQQQGSGGGASNAHAAPAVSPGPAAPATLEGLLGLPVRELRALLAARGGSAEGVVEKADLAARVLAAVGQQRD